jgi:dihydropteroate synthase
VVLDERTATFTDRARAGDCVDASYIPNVVQDGHTSRTTGTRVNSKDTCMDEFLTTKRTSARTDSPVDSPVAGHREPRPLPDPAAHVAVMAIVNRTQDSFFDQGATWELEAAIEAGCAAADAGADLIDVGGVKFAPGEAIAADDESARVVPVIEALRARRPGVLLSVDTFHASVAADVIAAGADVINDTTGLSDPAMAEVVAQTGASIILCHSLAAPRRPYPQPRYTDVVEEVRDFLASRVERALEAGIRPDRIVLDPGPDLNKSTVDTLKVLREWREYTALGYPTLAALSRKDVIGESLGLPKEERLPGSLAAELWAVQQGARILRVHDVAATVGAIRMIETIQGLREPEGPLVHNV